jgi:hypothetical protein
LIKNYYPKTLRGVALVLFGFGVTFGFTGAFVVTLGVGFGFVVVFGLGVLCLATGG